MTSLLRVGNVACLVFCQVEEVEIRLLIALIVLGVKKVVPVGRGIGEICLLLVDCELDRPAADAWHTPDVVSAGNVRLEIEMLTVNRPA